VKDQRDWTYGPLGWLAENAIWILFAASIGYGLFTLVTDGFPDEGPDPRFPCQSAEAECEPPEPVEPEYP
jgi:hypothetical protein